MTNMGFLQRFIMESSGGFVLAFHEIPPDRLAELVECLLPAKPVSLSEIVERTKLRKTTSGLFAITVDDGVGENVRALSRLCVAKQWPVTFYLPTQYIDTAEGMAFQWWRRLKGFLPHKRIELTSGPIDLSTPGAVDQLSRKMEVLWHTQRLHVYYHLTMELVELVSRQCGMDAIMPPAPITWSEVEALSKNELIRFESHGVSHAAMSTLTGEELAFELKHSRDVVSEHTGRPCRHLAYPFGSPQSIGNRAAVAAERFYDSASTMSMGRVDASHPWLLPRIPLYLENSTRFARLKVFLKCGANIPLVWRPAA
jgi:peptidoglycan/xylan/chitin deacetylase (PgdA/CDA1 family)